MKKSRKRNSPHFDIALKIFAIIAFIVSLYGVCYFGSYNGMQDMVMYGLEIREKGEVIPLSKTRGLQTETRYKYDGDI